MRSAAVGFVVLLIASGTAGCLAGSSEGGGGADSRIRHIWPGSRGSGETDGSGSPEDNGTDGGSGSTDGGGGSGDSSGSPPGGSGSESVPPCCYETQRVNFTHRVYASYTTLWDWEDVELNLTRPYQALLVQANWSSEAAIDRHEMFRVLEANSSRELGVRNATPPLRWQINASDVGQGSYLLRAQVADESLPDRPANVVVERQVHVAVTIFRGMAVPEGFSAWA